MAYRTSFSLLNTEKLNDITVKSGNYSATFTYPYENAEGTIPASECESDVDMNYSLEFTENNPYGDESLATYMYHFSFSNLPNRGDGINASAWSLEGIQLLSSGYLPLTLTNDNYNNLMFVHPSIQIPNITINGNDYWESHKSQYNEMIDKSITPLTIDLKGYPVNNTISIVDPTDEYYYTDNNDNEINNYPLTKNTNLTIKIGKMPEFWEVPRELTAQGVYQYPSNNFSVTLPDSVTSIDNYALYRCFYGCSTVTSFNSNNVTSIDNYSLYDCFDSCINLTSVSDFDNVTNIGKYGLTDCFYNCTSLTTAPTFANLTTIGQSGLSQCFYNCSNLTTGPILGKVTSLTYNALYGCFSGCTSLTTAPTLANLTTIGGMSAMQDCFSGCTSLTTPPTFDKLTSVSYQGLCYCFYNCTSLTTAPTFANLTTLTSGSPLSSCFEGCTSLTTPPTFDKLNSINSSSCLRNCFKNTIITSLSFPALKSTSFGSYTNQFDDMLSGVTGCTVHFPSNLQSVIGSWSDVTGGFGGTNTTVLFDLPATS